MAFSVTDGTTTWDLTTWQALDKSTVLNNIVATGETPYDSFNLFEQVKTNINVDGLITSATVNFSYMFRGCINFNNDVNHFDVQYGIEFGSMFSGCTSFNQSVSSWDMRYAQDTRDMFMNCASMKCWSGTNFVLEGLGDTYWNGGMPKPGDHIEDRTGGMFEGCGITHASIIASQPNTILHDAMVLHLTLSNVSQSDWDNIHADNRFTDTFNASVGLNSYTLTEWQALDKTTITKEVSLTGNAPTDASGLCEGVPTSINIDGLTTGGTTNMYAMFKNCGLFNTTMNHFDTTQCTNMAEMFRGCVSFNSQLINLDTRLVSDMTSMFEDCTSMVTWACAQFVIKNGCITTDIIKNCQNMAAVSVAGQTNTQFADIFTGKLDLMWSDRWSDINNNIPVFAGLMIFGADKVHGALQVWTHDEWIAQPSKGLMTGGTGHNVFTCSRRKKIVGDGSIGKRC